MNEQEKIVRLIETKGTRRVYELSDGVVETREGGSVSWRNNNPGNLKYEFAGSADKTVSSPRTYEAALASARARSESIVALDQWGNAIFETLDAGRATQAALVLQRHGGKTIPEMVKQYAKDDYSGQANHDAYAKPVYAVGDSQGVNLRDKKIKDLSDKEFRALLEGMKKVEGFQEGTLTRTQPWADTASPALSPEQQRVHQLASDALARQLSAIHSPEQIDTLARAAAAAAMEKANLGNVQGVFVSKDQQTIALKQDFGISEIGVQEALGRGPADASLKTAVAASYGPLHVPQPVELPQIAAMTR